MPILIRTPMRESPRSILLLRDGLPLGPGPAMVNNNAVMSPKAAQDAPVTLPDPSERNPDAALNNYVSRLGPEFTVGIVLVVFISILAIVLWVRYDENARKRVKKWAAAVRGWRTRQGTANAARNEEGLSSPGARSDITRVNTPMDENAMRASTDLRPTLTRTRPGSEVSLMKTSQISALPALSRF